MTFGTRLARLCLRCQTARSTRAQSRRPVRADSPAPRHAPLPTQQTTVGTKSALAPAIAFGLEVDGQRLHDAVVHDVGADEDRKLDDFAVVEMAAHVGEYIVRH